MQNDAYTKIVLTVIAAALVWLGVVLTPIGTPVRAAQEVQHVIIDGWMHADNTGQLSLRRIRTAESFPVVVRGQ